MSLLRTVCAKEENVIRKPHEGRKDVLIRVSFIFYTTVEIRSLVFIETRGNLVDTGLANLTLFCLILMLLACQFPQTELWFLELCPNQCLQPFQLQI